MAAAQKAKGPPEKYSILKPGDAVVPTVLCGIQTIEIPVADGALPPAWKADAAQAYELAGVEDLPAWISSLPQFAILQAQDVLGAFQIANSDDKTVYSFDLRHRLDDFTLLGRPAEGEAAKIPVLSVKLPPKVVADDTGEELSILLRRLAKKDGSAGEVFVVSTSKVSDLPARLREVTPRLSLEETWCLSSLSTDTVVGAPAGSVSLMPGEVREISISAELESSSKRTQKASLLNKLTDATKREFKREFKRTTKHTGSYKSTFQWSRTDSPEGMELKSGQDRERSTEQVVEDVRSTVDTITTERTRESEVSVSEEFEQSTKTVAKSSRKVTLKNETAHVVTYIYHHLNEVFRLNLDLVRVRLFFSGSGPDDPPRHIELDGSIRTRLPASIPASKRVAVATRVQEVFSGRYADLKIADQPSAGSIKIKHSALSDDNRRMSSRSALTAKRRKTGPLPVCMASWEHPVQTSGLHPVPHLSEFATPSPIPKPAAAPTPPKDKPPGAGAVVT